MLFSLGDEYAEEDNQSTPTQQKHVDWKNNAMLIERTKQYWSKEQCDADQKNKAHNKAAERANASVYNYSHMRN